MRRLAGHVARVGAAGCCQHRPAEPERQHGRTGDDRLRGAGENNQDKQQGSGQSRRERPDDDQADMASAG